MLCYTLLSVNVFSGLVSASTRALIFFPFRYAFSPERQFAAPKADRTSATIDGRLTAPLRDGGRKIALWRKKVPLS